MKESNNIYELLNRIEFNIDDYKREELSELEKKKLKKSFRRNIKRKINTKRTAIVAASIILTMSIFIQTNLGEMVYAAAKSKITEITYSIGKALGIENDIEPYANVVNQVVENNGIGMKLTDVIIDKDELIFSVIVNTNEPVDGIDFDYNVYLNGKKLTNYGAISSGGTIDESNTIFSRIYFVDTKGIKTDENVDIKIVVENLHYYKDDVREKAKGKWEFEFTANGEELMKDTYALPLDYSFNIEETTYVLEEFRYNPVNQKIFGKIKNKSNDSYHIKLRGFDNLGNEVVFSLNSVSGEECIFRYENLYGEFSKEANSITLTPYAAKLPEKSGKVSDDYKQVGEKFTIFLR